MKIYVLSRLNLWDEDTLLENEVKVFKDIDEAVNEYKNMCLEAEGEFEMDNIDHEKHYDQIDDKTFTFEIWEEGRMLQNAIKIKLEEMEI